MFLMYNQTDLDVFNQTEAAAPTWLMQMVLLYVVPVFFALITLCGVLGNILVIVVYAVNRNLQDSTYALIINLAIADLTFLVFCVPFTAVQYALGWWPFGALYCSVNMYLTYVSAYASVWTLVLLAFDRYIAVVHATSAVQLRTPRNSVRGCVCVWLGVGLINVPVLYTSRHFPLNENTYMCVDNYQRLAWDDTVRRSYTLQVKAFYYGFNFCSFILPLGLTCLLYLRLVQRLWKNTMGPEHRVSRETLRMKKRVSQLVAIVTLTFAICWLPQNLKYAELAYVYPEQSRTPPMLVDLLVQVFAQALAYTNSCINPILFGLVSENFRKGFRALFGCAQLKTRSRRLQRSGGRRTGTTKRSRTTKLRTKSGLPLLIGVNCTKVQRYCVNGARRLSRRASMSAATSLDVQHQQLQQQCLGANGGGALSDTCLPLGHMQGQQMVTDASLGALSGTSAFTTTYNAEPVTEAKNSLYSMDANRMAQWLAARQRPNPSSATLAANTHTPNGAITTTAELSPGRDAEPNPDPERTIPLLEVSCDLSPSQLAHGPIENAGDETTVVIYV